MNRPGELSAERFGQATLFPTVGAEPSFAFDSALMET